MAADRRVAIPPTPFGGQRWPDIVGALHVKQGWGEAQVSGVIHNVNVDGTTASTTHHRCGLRHRSRLSATRSRTRLAGAVDAGVKFNLPSFGAGDDIILTGAYTQNAVWYSGLADAMNGENGQVNGNGQPMYPGRRLLQPADQSVVDPTAWSVSALARAPLDADLLHRS